MPEVTRYMTLRDAAETIGVPKTALDTEARRGRLRIVRIAGRRYVPPEALVEFQQLVDAESKANRPVDPPAISPMSPRFAGSVQPAKPDMKAAQAAQAAAMLTLQKLRSAKPART